MWFHSHVLDKGVYGMCMFGPHIQFLESKIRKTYSSSKKIRFMKNLFRRETEMRIIMEFG